MPTTKRPTYKAAIEIIALNFAADQDLDGDMTVGVIADLFGKEAAQVAADVRKFREKNEA